MQLTRRQFLRALVLLPALALPDLVHAQGPGETHKVCLPLVSGDGSVTVPDGCSTDPILALVCANGDRLDLLTWEAGFELDDPGWRPQVAQFKGGGSYSNSQIAEGQTLVAGEYDNVVETIPLIGRGTDEAKCIQTYRRLQQFIKRAADYWKEPSEYDCVWLEARPAGEGCRTGYARVIKATCADFANPFGQPFFSQQAMSVADGLSLVVEREPLWRAVPPGEMVGPLYNLLKNPDFEDWNSGVADSQPDCWSNLETFWIIGDNSRDADPKWGRYCLKVHSGNSVQANGAKGVTQTVEGTEDGQTYTVVGWIRNGGVTNGVGRLLVTSLLGQYEVYRESARHGWELHTFTFTAGVGDVIGVNCEILSTAAGCDGEVFFDSLMLLKGDWEEEAIAQVLPYMTSSHIVNHWDTGEGDINFVDCWEVPGDADALVRLEVVNDTTPADYTNVVEKFGRVYVGQRRTGDVQNFKNDHDPAGVVDATCSNGDRLNLIPTPEWSDVTSHAVIGEGDVRDNVGRFRILARLYDAKTNGSPTLEARLAYWLGQTGAGVKQLSGVTLPQRATWNMVNLTGSAAMIADAKFRSNMPGTLSYTLQLRRPTGTGDARLDYVLTMPTDGGILEAEVTPGLEPGVALVCDNTSSSSVAAEGIKNGFLTRSDTTGNLVGSMAAYKGAVYATFFDFAGNMLLYRYYGGAWSLRFTFPAVTPDTGRMAVYNGLLWNPVYSAPNSKLYSSPDGLQWTLKLTQAGGSTDLLAWGGYLWWSMGAAGSSVYHYDGTTSVSTFTSAAGLCHLAVYGASLYLGVDEELYRWNGAAWVLVATWDVAWNAVLFMCEFGGKLLIWTITGELLSYDGSTVTHVMTGPGTSPACATVLNGTLYVGTVGTGAGGTVYSSMDGLNFSQVYDISIDREAIQAIISFEGALHMATVAGGVVPFTYVYTLTADISFQYSIANYQIGGGQDGGFTAPNRRLRDDERRHRWVVSFDRSDGSNVISDRALVGVGYVSRYLSLLGSG